MAQTSGSNVYLTDSMTGENATISAHWSMGHTVGKPGGQHTGMILGHFVVSTSFYVTQALLTGAQRVTVD